MGTDSEAEVEDFIKRKNWVVTKGTFVHIREEHGEISTPEFNEACQKQLAFITSMATELEKLE